MFNLKEVFVSCLLDWTSNPQGLAAIHLAKIRLHNEQKVFFLKLLHMVDDSTDTVTQVLT
jgi:hypothetical protein